MKKEDEELLLRDICMRPPYGVKGECKLGSTYSVDMIFRYHCFDAELVGIKNDGLYVHPLIEHHAGFEFANKEVADGIGFDNFKPYLRPLSSMTEEEEEEYEEVIRGSFEKQLEFYLRKHLDFRGLIPKGLALEALDGMYNK